MSISSIVITEFLFLLSSVEWFDVVRRRRIGRSKAASEHQHRVDRQSHTFLAYRMDW